MNYIHYDSWMGGRQQYFLPMYYFILSLCVCVCVYRERINYMRVYIYTYTYMCACVHAKSILSGPDLCNSVDYSPPGSSTHGVLQARILSGLSRLPPWHLPNSGIEPCLLCLLHKQVGSLRLAPPGRAHTSGEQTSPTDTCKW